MKSIQCSSNARIKSQFWTVALFKISDVESKVVVVHAVRAPTWSQSVCAYVRNTQKKHVLNPPTLLGKAWPNDEDCGYVDTNT